MRTGRFVSRGLANLLAVALLGRTASAQSDAAPSTFEDAASAELTESKSLEALPLVDARIRVDGLLDEAAWASAQVGTDFVERVPTPGAPAPAGHEVRVLFDRDALYVGVRLPLDASRGERPRALELRRDSFDIFDDDTVSVKVDVRYDRRTTIGFATNAAETQLDYIALENGVQFRREYDAVWTVGTHVEEDAWYAEFRLPAAALGIPASDRERILGLNITRDHSTRAATYDWSAIPPEFGAVTALYYGQLSGVDALGGGRPLVLIPYALGRYQSEGVDRIDDVDSRGEFNVGGDIQFRLLEDLWSELTINPDFAQVDLDDPVVNFDRFPLFFPERRPFFLTGLQVFDFGVREVSQVFFSRRIGLDQSGEEIPVISGLKIYGSQGPWQTGLFQVFTAKKGDEEAASFSIARLRRNFGEIAHLGAIGTFRADIAPFEDRPVPALPKGSAGVDGSLRLVDRRLVFTSFWAYANNTLEDAAADEGHSARGAVTWRGEYLQPEVSVLLVDRDFDPAVGFVRRRGIIQSDLTLAFVRRPRADQSLQVQVDLRGRAVRASDRDENLGQSAQLDTTLRWRSGWIGGFSTGFGEDVVEEDFTLFGRRTTVDGVPVTVGGRTIEAGRYRGPNASVFVASPSVRNPFVDISYFVDANFFGGIRHGPGAFATVSFGPHVRLEADADLSFSGFDDGFHREAFTLASTLTVAPTNRLQADTIVQVNTIAENVNSLLRIRWRYLPGSDVFLVGRYQLDFGEERLHRFELTAKLQFRYDLLL